MKRKFNKSNECVTLKKSKYENTHNLYYDLPANCIALVDENVHKLKMQDCLADILKFGKDSIRPIRVLNEKKKNKFTWCHCKVRYELYHIHMVPYQFYPIGFHISEYNDRRFSYGYGYGHGTEILKSTHKYNSERQLLIWHLSTKFQCNMYDICTRIKTECKEAGIVGYSKLNTSNKHEYIRLLYGRKKDEPIGSRIVTE
uniref:Uncharacterized protein n=1 Tax=viral metagenome TaxID=1070528 RepID=A0A6C0F6F0_9ZZZZ|tara:strand:+ start:423 stop:1022 length:600 start_codon:yes stop_codon:yes gene_type:complete